MCWVFICSYTFFLIQSHEQMITAATRPDHMLLTQLVQMGVSAIRAARALLLNHNNLNKALDWLAAHVPDAETDELPPLSDVAMVVRHFQDAPSSLDTRYVLL
jgi:uncharacterized UBP type Zn finger protein